MKIVDVNEFYAERGGGVRTYVNAKLAAASKLGHELVVIAPGERDGEESRLGGKIRWVQGPPMPVDPRYFVLYREREVHRLIDLERPDVLEGSSPWTAGWFAARYPGPGAKALIYHQDPVAVYPQTLLDRWLPSKVIDEACFPYWQYVRSLAKHFDVTVVAGHWLAERLRGFGVPRPQAVPFGIDRGQFGPERRDLALRAELLSRCGLSEDASVLVCISRHHPEKRLPFLFRALELAQRERDVGLVVFGTGPMRAWIERQASRVRGVHLAGFVDDRPWLSRALASADALLHGSTAETYGFVIAEAMCAGTPVIAPNRGGAFDLVEPEFSESFVAGDEQSCADAILRLLARDRMRLCHSAVAAAERKVWTTEQHFAALFELYESLSK